MLGRPALTLALLAVTAVPASAAETVAIRSVDTSRLPDVRVTVTAASATGAGRFRVTENGRRVAPHQLDVQPPSGATAVALVVDTSQSMQGRPIRAAVAAAADFLGRKRPADEIALFTFGHRVQTVQPLTRDPNELALGLHAVAIDPTQGTALNDGVAAAVEELETRPPTTRRVVVVLSDGEDNASTIPASAVETAAVRGQVAVHSVAIRSALYTPRTLQAITGRTGGSFHEAETSDLREVYRSIARDLARTYVISYRSQASDLVDLTVEAGGERARTSYDGNRPSTLRTGDGVVPERITHASWSAPVLALLVLALLLAGGLAVFRPRPRKGVRQLLAPYGRTVVQPEQDREQPKMSFVRHVAVSTERLLGDLRFWKRIGKLIERADLPLRTAELFYVMLAAAIVAGVAASLLGAPLPLRAAALAIGATLPLLFVRHKARSRQKAFEDQLPDTLMTMASSMKAGHSFNQAIETIIKEGSDPAAAEFARASSEIRLGRAADVALDDMARRLDSQNFGFVVTSVNVQRQVGGSLAEILDGVAETVRQRQQFRRKVKALTAMGRASAYVLLALPFFLGALIFVMNREFMMPLFTDPAGRLLLMAGLVSLTIGGAILKKIVSFKV
jgi:tight adherence protein B